MFRGFDAEYNHTQRDFIEWIESWQLKEIRQEETVRKI